MRAVRTSFSDRLLDVTVSKDFHTRRALQNGLRIGVDDGQRILGIVFTVHTFVLCDAKLTAIDDGATSDAIPLVIVYHAIATRSSILELRLLIKASSCERCATTLLRHKLIESWLAISTA